jgi:hypothetical protein
LVIVTAGTERGRTFLPEDGGASIATAVDEDGGVSTTAAVARTTCGDDGVISSSVGLADATAGDGVATDSDEAPFVVGFFRVVARFGFSATSARALDFSKPSVAVETTFFFEDGLFVPDMARHSARPYGLWSSSMVDLTALLVRPS